ncbi:hemolysin [Bacteroidia bacterium]|nr:hemolysin [Bacteroidia bacterium]
MNENKDIELRSEEVQEVLGAVPAWILRWGITTLFAIVVVLLAGSWFFKYPDTISATMILTGTTPPAGIVAKTNGRIQELYVKDKQSVKAKEYLAVIENPAVSQDMLLLKQRLEKLQQTPDFAFRFPQEELRLGTVQSVYTSFIRSLNTYQKFVELNYYPQKITTIETRIVQYRQQYQNQERQHNIAEQQHIIAGKLYKRDSSLYLQKVISQEAIEKSENDFLQNRLSLENAHATLKNLQIQISQLQETLLDTEQQYADNKNRLELEMNTLTTQLLNEINTWEMNFALISPIDGNITFAGYWSENQNVIAGETVFTVIPKNKTAFIGKAQLPVARSGKVKKGQQVNIHFLNYPDNEFGMVRGVVSNISLVPVKEHYAVEIALPNGLLTTYKKDLPFSQEMTANIEIVTEDMRLLERFILPLKRIWKEKI